MKRLTLVRHANADWKDVSVADFDRPLNKRGFSEAEAIAKSLVEAALVPDLMLASTARRAQQTAEILGRRMDLLPRHMKSAEHLYLARPDDILTLVRATGPRIQHLIIVGHNPGISELAKLLGPVNVSITELGTAAACSLTFTVRNWPSIAPPAANAGQYAPPSKLFGLFA
ncbi:MAG: SixA phosphatase family protein [Steroidobacteraceae bacterium]